MRIGHSRNVVVVGLSVGLLCAFLLTACATEGEPAPGRRAKPQTALGVDARPETRPATGPGTRPTTRTARAASTKPSTRPTTGPTEQSADGVQAPPAPALSPEEALKTFTLAPGFHIELVAAEPLIQDPVVIAFDADGRMWAAEMTSYMPDARGNGEKEPTGKIVILEDADGDGKMDKRSVWLDGLILPRAVLPLRDGALVGAPPNLSFWRDTDGNGRADRQTLVASDYGNPRQNPEHQANGLLLAMDNWVYSVNYDKRFRWMPDEEAIAAGDKLAVKWTSSRIPTRGQWGQSMDDWGRLYHNSNSDYLRADLVPPHYYAGRNPHYDGRAGVNVQLDRDQTVWPIRPTPAVNRGYRENFLRPDGTLREFTAACAPCVYRGGIFPKDCDGDVFVCEPSAHLVRRAKITEDGLQLKGRNAYDRKEFLASTDERFRPVNLSVGPDGALYVVDMYRGILQHAHYLTGYLRELHLRRDMELPVHLGRIYRIVHEATPPRKVLKMSELGTRELVEKLSDANGWVRDTAQRLLVERQDWDTPAAVEHVVTGGMEEKPSRVHGLWVMEGMGLENIDPCVISTFPAHEVTPRTAAAALRMCEPRIGEPRWAEMQFKAQVLFDLSRDPLLRLQCAYAIRPNDPGGIDAISLLLAEEAENKIIRDAVFSSLAGVELEVLEYLLQLEGFGRNTSGADAVLGALAGCVVREGKPQRVERLLQLAAGRQGEAAWHQVAILSGMADVAKKSDREPTRRPIEFAAEPHRFVALADSKDAEVRRFIEAIDPLFHWPGKVDEKVIAAPPLTAEQQKLFDEGKILFGATCAACHQPGGEGLEGKAPPLRNSPWLLGPEGRLIRIVLNGVKGPIHIRDEVINMEMPNLSALDDRQIASVLTYARREWGHAADPVEPEDVARVREQTKDRADAWTEPELLKVKG